MLVINFLCFIIEATTGIISQSMGLVADSLDMLADALVYGMSLMAVGTTIARQQKVAKLSGYLQISLAVLGLIEVIKRFMGLETPPDFLVMIVISFIALIANTASLWLLQRTKSKEAHIQASVIFSANDVIVNIGVIVAGLLVGLLNSNAPDLIIGIIVFLIVIRGAIRILKLSK
nr:cation transporter [Porphyromonas sp. COT-108 OH2963]